MRENFANFIRRLNVSTELKEIIDENVKTCTFVHALLLFTKNYMIYVHLKNPLPNRTKNWLTPLNN